MKTDRLILALVAIGLVATITLFNISISSKEAILEHGKLVLLEMAPVDPRSPFQGDYMSINYKGLSGFNLDSIPKSGYCILKNTESNVYVPLRFEEKINSLGGAETPIRYTTDKWSIHIGASSYFFEEGKAAQYDSAKYAGLRVSPSGKSVLVGLYDKNRVLIK
ncbi:MAG: GDYXXLXY domain-containing protein [Bacteroidota bacterium]